MTTLNLTLDHLVRPRLRIAGRDLPAFTTCGLIGLAFAWVLALSLVAHQGLPLWPMAVVALAAMATFLALAMVTKIITGEERLVYYHHEIAVIATAALLLWLLDRPVLRYLDATILGVGLFLAFGRIGCFLVGCCHGRPARCGVRYRVEHAAAGFTSHYVGVRLFPIQAVESLWVFFLVAVGAGMVLADRPPGTALVWYVVAYDAGRFVFEFVRGDPDRPNRGGFSSPQWLSVILTLAVVIAGWADLLPTRPWHVATAAGLTLAMLAIALHRRRSGDNYRLRHPHHVRELATAMANLAVSGAGSSGVPIQSTSRGIRISGGAVSGEATAIEQYTFSSDGKPLTIVTARILADLVLSLRSPAGGGELLAGGNGVYHVLIRR